MANTDNLDIARSIGVDDNDADDEVKMHRAFHGVAFPGSSFKSFLTKAKADDGTSDTGDRTASRTTSERPPTFAMAELVDEMSTAQSISFTEALSRIQRDPKHKELVERCARFLNHR